MKKTIKLIDLDCGHCADKIQKAVQKIDGVTHVAVSYTHLWLVLFRQIILFIPLCVVLPMIGGMGIRGVWLAIALTDAILVVITISMMLYEFRRMPATLNVKR